MDYGLTLKDKQQMDSCEIIYWLFEQFKLLFITLRFWQHGKWVEVVIDDRLPTYAGQLIGMHSDKKNEFWSSLLEKAYAKLHGSWVALEGGWNGEALADLTGGIAQHWPMEEAPADLFDILLEAQERKSLFGTGILAVNNNKLKR